jgi:hypothetical protein
MYCDKGRIFNVHALHSVLFCVKIYTFIEHVQYSTSKWRQQQYQTNRFTNHEIDKVFLLKKALNQWKISIVQ